MTSPKNEINQLIADIDTILVNSGNPLSKLLTGHGNEEKDVLQRARDVLARLNPDEIPDPQTTDQPSQTPPKSSLITRYVEQEQSKAALTQEQYQIDTIKQTTEQLKEEVSGILQPLQGEISTLLEERAALVQEIRELEQKRLQNYSLSQQLAHQERTINEFIQVLISRLVPNLIPYLTQNSLPNSGNLATTGNSQEVSESSLQAVAESTQSLERLNVLTRDLDQRLLSLDGTVNVVFEALERNINTYYQSLSQVLTRMHSQGMQGEELMTNFVSSLQKYLQQYSPDGEPFVFSFDSGTPEKTDIQTSEQSEQFEEQETSSSQVTKLQDSPTLLMEDVVNQQPTQIEQELNQEVNIEPIVNQEIPTKNETITPSEVTEPESPQVISNDLQSLLFEDLNLDDSEDRQEVDILEDLDIVLSQLSSQEPENQGDQNLQTSLAEDLNLDDETQEPEIIEDLDILLSQLTAERRSTPEAASLTTPEPEPENDQVDELYASLFGSGDAINESEQINVTTSVEVPQPLSNEQENELTPAQLLDGENNQPLPESLGTSSETTEQTRNLWEQPLLLEDTQSQAEFAQSNSSEDLQPNSSDTITVLTDLLIDFSGEEQETEVSDQQQVSETPLPENPLVESDVPKSSQEDKIRTTGYITASPQENLLPQENDETKGIPNIVVDEQQLQQLDQDLANLDQQFNVQRQETRDLESGDSRESLNLEIPSVEVPSSPTSDNVPLADVSELVADLYHAGDEKKKEGTNSQPSATVLNNQSLDQDDESRDTGGLSFENKKSVWYLGIDLGTTGISAALFNISESVVYPIYWSTENREGQSSFQQSFRLPAEVYLPTASVPQGENENRASTQQTKPGTVAKQNLYSTHLKPFLQVAIPYKNSQQKWEPVLQLNEFSAGPLIWVLRSLSKLLLTLKSDQTSTTPALIAHGLGIEKENFLSIINNDIAGVVCTCPSNWSEQYRFNVREAILTSQLVSHPQKIFFVEEAIATLLPELDIANSQPIQLRANEGLQSLKTSDSSLRGSTLGLNIGAVATEMVLVDLPTDLNQLTYRDFMLHSFAYGGKAIEQDIICQLLLPPKSRQPKTATNTNTDNNYPRSWQPAIPGLDQVQWSSLNLAELELPRVGDPDVHARMRLQQRLESSVLGQGLLTAAATVKLILQRQESFSLELADQRWILQRRDLETQIFVPYVRRLNREVNKLLVARGIPTEAINQAIISGGVTSITTINRWLKQKLPNTKIIQDTYLGKHGTPNCSRVAYGLTLLPLYPQVLEIPRQQYTDYFLFTEMLKVLGEYLPGDTTRSLSFGEVLQLFESRGINTRICQQRLLAFLEGELPAGLVPAIVLANLSPEESDQTALNFTWLTQKSQQNPDYQAIASTPLFEKQGNLSYRPNLQQLSLLRHYLQLIQNSSLQSLEEPYAVNFPVANPS